MEINAGRAQALSPTRGARRRQKRTEAIMRDEIYDREYQAGREALHAGIDRLVAEIGQTFRMISAIQFSAPWRVPGGRTGAA